MALTEYLPAGTTPPDDDTAGVLTRLAEARLRGYFHQRGYLIDEDHQAWHDAVDAYAAVWHANGIHPTKVEALTERTATTKRIGSAQITYSEDTRTRTIESLLNDIPTHVAALAMPAVRRRQHPLVIG